MIGRPGRQTLFTFWVLGLVTCSEARAQRESVELLLPGTEYHVTDLPPDPSGTWWVLYRPSETPTLEALQVVVRPIRGCGDEATDEPSGRAVTVSQAREPILMVRGLPDLSGGPVRTAFVNERGTGEASRVELQWGDQQVTLRHLAAPPLEDRPGRYHVELTVGAQRFELHTVQWHGDGHWLVRWVGDLNRDGLPDVLLDASYKYSVHTTRLFLSRATAGHIEFTEAARFEHTAC